MKAISQFFSSKKYNKSNVITYIIILICSLIHVTEVNAQCPTSISGNYQNVYCTTSPALTFGGGDALSDWTLKDGAGNTISSTTGASFSISSITITAESETFTISQVNACNGYMPIQIFFSIRNPHLTLIANGVGYYIVEISQSSIASSSGPGTNWNDPRNQQVFYDICESGSGVVNATISNGGCLASLPVTYTGVDAAIAGPTKVACGSSTIYNGTQNGGTGVFTVTPSNAGVMNGNVFNAASGYVGNASIIYTVNYAYTIPYGGGQSANVTCSATKNINVTCNNSCTWSLTETHMPVKCHQGSDGQATMTASGANGNVTYAWSDGGSGSFRDNLTAGNYTVIATYATNCTSSTYFTITQHAAFLSIVSCNSTAVSTNGGNNGTATAIAAGGTPPYTYLWSNTQNTSTINNLGTGSYTVVVTDSKACTSSSFTSIAGNGCTLTTSITGATSLCNGTTTTILTTSGSATATYLWSNGMNTQAITVGLGTYSVTVTDGICSAISSVIVSNTPANVGNYVWLDRNYDGFNNELSTEGFNGATVQLRNTGVDGIKGNADDQLIATTITANNVNGNPGYYNLQTCVASNYYIRFILPNANGFMNIVNQTLGMDNNSDADNVTGMTGVFYLDPNGTNIQKNNMTIDAAVIINKSIGQLVWLDNNKNGIKETGDVGIAGINVQLLDVNDNVINTTITNNEGTYIFENLRAGIYKLRFLLPIGYTFTLRRQGTNTRRDSDVFPTGFTDTINIPVNVIFRNNEDAGIYATPGTESSLGDFVWNDLNKNGIQESNEPGIENVTLTLSSSSDIKTTTTNADGKYLFQELGPMIYYERITMPQGFVMSPRAQGSSRAFDSDFNVAGFDVSNINLGLTTNKLDIDAGMYRQNGIVGSIGNSIWNDLNHNGYREGNENGVSGITINLLDKTGVQVLDSTLSDGLGKYSFNEIVPDEYMLEFTNLPAGYAFTQQVAGVKNSDANITTGRTALINLHANEIISTIDAGLYNQYLPTGSIGNKVWYDLNNNGLQDSEENGVSGVNVYLCDVNNNVLNNSVTDIEGHYYFNNLASGSYKVSIANLPEGYTFTSINLTNSNINNNFDINGMSDVIQLSNIENNVSIDAGIIKTNTRHTTILGDKVWFDDNADGLQNVTETGVENIQVNLLTEDGNTVLESTKTDVLGNYRFNNITSNKYKIGFENIPALCNFCANNAALNSNFDSNVGSDGKTDTISIASNQFNFSIDAGIHQLSGVGSIGNIVWNDINKNGSKEANETGVSGVSVLLLNALTNDVLASTISNEEGYYHFNALNPSQYKIKVTALQSGYYISPKIANNCIDSITLESDLIAINANDKITTANIGIYTINSSVGNYVWEDLNSNGVQEPTEKGLAGITVTLYNQDNEALVATVTNSNGKFNFSNLETGNYYLGYSTLPIGSFITTKNIGNINQDNDVNPLTGYTDIFTLSNGEINNSIDAGIAIYANAGVGNIVWFDQNANGIQDVTEQGLAGVQVNLYDINDNVIKTTITNADGKYSFSNVIPGNYTLGIAYLPSFYSTDGNLLNTSFTLQNLGTNANNNDFNSVGRTAMFTLINNEYNSNIDAGLLFNTPLPVTIKQFDIVNSGCTINIHWTTESEVNVKEYGIMRDGKLIGLVKAKSTNGNVNTYSYIDNGIENGKSYQSQLKVYDIDGSTTTYNTIKEQTVDCKNDEIFVYPNPTNDYIYISYNASSIVADLDISLYDMLGNKLLSKTFNSNQTNLLKLDVSAFATGTYILQINNLESGVYTRKIEVKK
jgi:hypothetical protein